MIEFPERAKVSRIIAKENFYNSIDTATKMLFQNEIQRITWEYKLAPNTINLPAKNWSEVEVFKISLKGDELSQKILKIIDTAIPYPILFIIEKNSAVKAVISYKELNQKDNNFTKVDTYFETDWDDKKLKNIKIEGLDIDTVFENFVRQVAGERLSATKMRDRSDGNASKSIRADVDAMKEREKIQKQIDAIDRKIRNEPSIGKKQQLAEEKYKLIKMMEEI